MIQKGQEGPLSSNTVDFKLAFLLSVFSFSQQIESNYK